MLVGLLRPSTLYKTRLKLSNMITPKNIVQHELIGLEAKIVDSANPSVIGIKGRVVDETRNTIILEVKKGRNISEKSFVKDQCVFSFRIKDQEGKPVWIKVDGKLIVARPEDRIKKRFKKW